MSSERYAIKVMCIGDSNTLKGIPIARYVMITPVDPRVKNLSASSVVANILIANYSKTPDLFEDKEEAIIRSHEIQLQLDRLRHHIASTKGSVEYFVRPIVWDKDRYVKDCKDSTWLTSKWQKFPIGTKIEKEMIADHNQ